MHKLRPFSQLRFRNSNKAILAGSAVALLLLWNWKGRPDRDRSPGTKSRTNRDHIDSLHPNFRPQFEKFVRLLERAGYNVQINSSYRDLESQARQYKAKKKNAPPGYSPHNYGAAIDIQLSRKGQSWGMNTPAKKWIETGIPKAAENFGLEWGGFIPGYYDPVHFSVKGINTAKLYAEAKKQKRPGNEIIIHSRA
jgi:hypothetical protein